jgi:polar amino acid transport system substrate-binding protein
MSPEIIAQLAPTGVLRAGINLSNFLLVTGRTAEGDPQGVSPSMAAAIAARLGVAVKYVPYPKPGELADAVDTGAWDIGLIGAEPQRAEKIAFTAAYSQIEATYLVPAGSPITEIAQVDQPGIRIAVTARAAYDLWLERNIHKATLLRTDTLDSALTRFVDEKLEVLAGLRPRLITDLKSLPGARILEDKFTAVQQAIGVRPGTIPGGKWSDCGNVQYDFNYLSELPRYKQWVAEGELQILIYNGDADYILSHMGNSAWINQGLALNKTREWTKWRGSDGQVAGYFEEYATAGVPLTFLTVKGAGHMVPRDRPKHALDMLTRFLAGGDFDKVPLAPDTPLCPP